jgi:hypothetical protein
VERTRRKTTQLGSTGIEITRIGFGAWAIGFRRPSQVDPILIAANLELVDDDLATIEGRS